MKQMTLSEICKLYGFTRRVIQVYEKEGLIKHSGTNKYGYLLFDEKDVRKIAQIRYLQKNGINLKEIADVLSEGGIDSLYNTSYLMNVNSRLRKEIGANQRLIERNGKIVDIVSSELDEAKRENDVYQIIMEELNEKDD